MLEINLHPSHMQQSKMASQFPIFEKFLVPLT